MKFTRAQLAAISAAVKEELLAYYSDAEVDGMRISKSEAALVAANVTARLRSTSTTTKP